MFFNKKKVIDSNEQDTFEEAFIQKKGETEFSFCNRKALAVAKALNRKDFHGMSVSDCTTALFFRV